MMGFDHWLREHIFGRRPRYATTSSINQEQVERAADELSRATVEVRTKINNLSAAMDDPFGALLHSIRQARVSPGNDKDG